MSIKKSETKNLRLFLVDQRSELSNFFMKDFMKVVDFINLFETELKAA